MDERQLRALLTLMNISAPEGTEWCAWSPEPGYLDKEYDIRDHWRFYLVGPESKMHDSASENLVWGD